MRGLLLLLPLLLLLLLTAACGGPDRDAPPPAVSRFGDFPDVPLPPGYAPLPGSEQLAIALGGGSLRRMQATLELPSSAKGPEDVQLWYRERLPALGWQAESLGGGSGLSQWRRAFADGRDEQLLIETGRAQGRPIMRLSLAPAS
jgi:hypothetical protein